MNASATVFEIEYVGPDDAAISDIFQQAVVAERLIVRKGRGFTFLESAAPPCHISITLTIAQIEALTAATLIAAYGKSVVGELGKDTYAAAKWILRALGRSLISAFERIKTATNRDTYYTVRVRCKGEKSVTYNVPGADVESALAALVDDILEGDRDPSKGDLFWDFGQWMDYDEHEAFYEAAAAEESGEMSVTTIDFFRACEEWSSIIGSPPVFSVLGNGRDVLIDVPNGVDATTRDRALRAMRSALPASKIGPAVERNRIYVSRAVMPIDSNPE